MIEILGTIYLGSFVVSAGLIFWQYFHVSRQLKSKSLMRLNSNLAKIKLYWSYTKGQFCPLDDRAVSQDAIQARRSVLLMGLLAFGSLLGLALLAAIIVSLRFLVSHRLENAVYQSSLTSDLNLSPEQVNSLVLEL